jgi:hypothetical protein
MAQHFLDRRHDPLGLAMEKPVQPCFLANQIRRHDAAAGTTGAAGRCLYSCQPDDRAHLECSCNGIDRPIAIDIATTMGANAQPFVLAAVVGASTSFLTPVGHQANVLIFGPGGYRFCRFCSGRRAAQHRCC